MKKEIKGSLVCSVTDVDKRLDVFLQEQLEGVSRSKIQDLIKNEFVKVNGKKTKSSMKLQSSYTITYDLSGVSSLSYIPPITQIDLPVEIVFEDSEILVVNKPVGLVTHPGTGNTEESLVHAVYDKVLKNDPVRPGVVHRLDKDTSGLLVLAKTQNALDSLYEQFKNKTAKRVYWALHFGKVKTLSGTWKTHLARNPKNRLKFSSQEEGKQAITNFKTIKTGPLNLTELSLETGRTHQIRVHLSENRFPILNDRLYGSEKNINSINDLKLKGKLKKIERMALVARKLSLKHPSSGEEMTFETPWPEDFNIYEDL